MLVGPSGAGKTNILMNGMIVRMQAGHIIHMVDQKKELAQMFENHVHIYKSEDTVDLIRKLTQAAQDRMEHFGQVGRQLGEPIRDIWEYELVTGKKLPIIWLFLEELLLVTKHIDQEELSELYIAGRSSGIFVYAAVQNLKVDTLSTDMSVNIHYKVYVGAPNKISMRTLFTAGVPKEVYIKSNSFLTQPGRGILYSNKKNSYDFIEFPRVDRETLKMLMRS